ncbi:MAG: carboxypeptidase-like regulatory domain-containing protein [Pyrinomonadaceae bacterium]
MKTHVDVKRAKKGLIRILVLTMACALLATSLPAQAPPPGPVPPPENIPAGALIIPMDNVNQGNASGTFFNLRAYGLANLFLQNDIPVKWAIKPGKSKDDVDFSANVTRIEGTQGVPGPASLDFAGGPFIVAQEFDTPALRSLITAFNGAGTPVTVYKTNADTSADVRYTLTHIPKIAIGPDGGGFGGNVYQGLFDRAGIPNYTTGVEDIDQQGACFTLATQGHQENDDFVNDYRSFVEGGGNLILQCASIGTFENHPNGHFQTTGAGYDLFTSNSSTGNPATEINSNAFAFPDGAMPFNQFIGLLADQDGLVTEYSYAPGAGPANGNLISVQNTGANSDVLVATVSQVNGPNTVGGVVFEFGGHNYNRPDGTQNVPAETDSQLAMLNGQRMQLNAVFVPSKIVCTQDPGNVIGYKAVRRFNVRDGGPPIIAGDTLIWTIDYINNSIANQDNFQVRDIVGEINGFLNYVPDSNIVVNVYGGATAQRNPAYDGVGNDASSDMLLPGAFLPPGGRIQLTVKTVIDLGAPRPYTLYNQTTARSDTIAASPSTRSDAIDATNVSIFTEDPPDPASVDQIQNGATINPTRVEIPAEPTAADVSIEGTVATEGGAGIANALVMVVNAATGESTSIRTNAFGFFRIEELEAGGLYLVTVRHKRYRFPTEPRVLTLTSDVTGLTFTGSLGHISNTKGRRPATPRL